MPARGALEECRSALIFSPCAGRRQAPAQHTRGHRQTTMTSQTMTMTTPTAKTHSKVIGYLLWIFGFTGSHRFYYGRPVSGTIWFFTLGLLGIGWLIDLFLIPGMDRDADQRFALGRINYSLAWVLLTYLGLLGIHRMYLGKWGTGLLYLLTGGLLGLGWLYDYWTLNQQISDLNRGG